MGLGKLAGMWMEQHQRGSDEVSLLGTRHFG